MSRYEQATYGGALQELKAVRQIADPVSRLFRICANKAWDWDRLPPQSWYVFDNGTPTWAGPTKRQQKFYEHLLVLVNDFDAVTSILYRLEWLRRQNSAQTNLLSADDLSVFLATDVHAFHVEFRSLMETLCHVINVVSAKPGQVPTHSFRALRKWCIENPDRSSLILSNELSELIAQAYWFIEIRNVRDRICHNQTDATVRIMTPPDEVVFFTLRSRKHDAYEGPNACIYNGWIYFRAHAGYYLGRLIFLLNEVCAMAANRLDLSLADVHWSTSRMSVVDQCIDYAIESLESGFPLTDSVRRQSPEKQPAPSASLHEKISTRAYYLSQAAESQYCDPTRDWLVAESQQLRSVKDD